MLGLLSPVLLLTALLDREVRAGGPEAAIVLLERPAKVTVTPGKENEPDWQTLDLRIEHGGSRFRVTTGQHARSFREAVAFQKADVRWRGPYLLIRWARGGGNAARGYLDLVFMLKKEKLLYLGEVEEDSRKGRTFTDVYNKFELNGLTSHAGAPLFPVVLEEKEGRLRVNLERTWRRSHGRFQENAVEIQVLRRKPPPLSGSSLNNLTESLLFNAVFSKYCNRAKELEETIQAAAEELKRNDPGALPQFTRIVSTVIPGELPRRAAEVVAE